MNHQPPHKSKPTQINGTSSPASAFSPVQQGSFSPINQQFDSPPKTNYNDQPGQPPQQKVQQNMQVYPQESPHKSNRTPSPHGQARTPSPLNRQVYNKRLTPSPNQLQQQQQQQQQQQKQQQPSIIDEPNQPEYQSATSDVSQENNNPLYFNKTDFSLADVNKYLNR